MKIISIILGILGFIFMVPGIIPCFGWLNWVNVLFSGVGLIIALYYFFNSESGNRDSSTKLAFVINLLAFLIGSFRLFLGGGFF